MPWKRRNLARDRARKKRWRHENAEHMRLYRRNYNRRRRGDLWSRVLAMYGAKCGCCGETNRKFLTLDHLDGSTRSSRNVSGCRVNAEREYFRALTANDPTKFGVACWNCNCGRATNGGVCPHKDSR